MISCVSISNCDSFSQNILRGQFELRYKEVILKERWENIYVSNGMEFDQYDNPATEYFVAHDDIRGVYGVTRSYPTTLPYMLENSFSHLFSKSIPRSAKVFEASRLVLDRTKLTKEERAPIIRELVLAYMERGLQMGIEAYVGFMLPKIWKSTFIEAGWDVEWLGEEKALEGTTDTVRAGLLAVSPYMHHKIKNKTGIYNSILDFGMQGVPNKPNYAFQSESLITNKKVA